MGHDCVPKYFLRKYLISSIFYLLNAGSLSSVSFTVSKIWPFKEGALSNKNIELYTAYITIVAVVDISDVSAP